MMVRQMGECGDILVPRQRDRQTDRQVDVWSDALLDE